MRETATTLDWGAPVMSVQPSTDYPDPWDDYASQSLPRSWDTVIQWGTRIWNSQPLYRAAVERAVRFFITNLVIEDCTDSERKKYKDFFMKQLDYETVLGALGNDIGAFGNSFSTIVVPFERFLMCPHCGHDRPIRKVQYVWEDMKFRGKCVACGKNGDYIRSDRCRHTGDSKYAIRLWDPRFMRLKHNIFTGETEYRYKLPPDEVQMLRAGDKFLLSTVPWEFIETAFSPSQLFKFDSTKIFHMRESTISSVRTQGFGMPRFMGSFRQAYYIQMLHRYNEALMMDYVIPLRLIFPRETGGIDPAAMMNLQSQGINMMEILRRKRRDPATDNWIPFPVDFAQIGGDGKQMATHEMLMAANTEFLDGLGVPAEMHRGNLSVQAAPMALRMFQQSWSHVPTMFNKWLQWCADEIASLRNWGKVSVSLQKVTLADDMEAKSMYMQLMAAGKISANTALSPVGLNALDEQKRIMEEDRSMRLQQQEMEKEEQERAEMEEALMQISGAGQQQGGGGPGAAPMGPQGMIPLPGGGGVQNQFAMNPGDSPNDITAKAQQIAQQMMQMQHIERRRMLKDMQAANPILYSQVKMYLEKMEQDAKSQGLQMARQGQM